MFKFKNLKKLVFLLSMSIMAVGCVPGGDGSETGGGTSSPIETNTYEDGEKILRTVNSSEPGSLDPALAQGTHESWILDHTFEGLMAIDKHGKIVPALASKSSLADDEVTYTFTLKDDLKWSNGQPITAEDFEYSWKRVLNPELAADYAHQLYYIEGAQAYNEGTGSVDDVKVKALDDKTLEVKLHSPTSYFLELTAFYTYYPISKDVDQANPDWANSAETHVSNGAFKLTEWIHDSSIKIRKNEHYHNISEVKLDGADFSIIDDSNTTWQAYEAGELDLLVDVPQAVTAKLKEEGNSELQIAGEVGTYYYNLNTEVKPFDNPKIRKGLALTLDRETIVEKIAQGGQIPATGVVPVNLKDENGGEYRAQVGDLVKFDIEEGKRLFEEGMKEEGLTEKDFSDFVLLYNTSESHKKIAQAVQEMWRANLGITIQLENVDFQVKLDREKEGDFHISRAGWIGDYMDPMTFIELWYSNSSFNDARYNNPEYDKLVDEAKSTVDPKVRFTAMRKAEKIIMEDMPVIPVYFYTKPYTQKSYVKDIYKPLVSYPVFKYADINK